GVGGRDDASPKIVEGQRELGVADLELAEPGEGDRTHRLVEGLGREELPIALVRGGHPAADAAAEEPGLGVADFAELAPHGADADARVQGQGLALAEDVAVAPLAEQPHPLGGADAAAAV